MVRQLPHQKRTKHLKDLSHKLASNPFSTEEKFLAHNDWLMYKANFLKLTNPKLMINQEYIDKIVESNTKDFETEKPDENQFLEKITGLINSVYDKDPQN